MNGHSKITAFGWAFLGLALFALGGCHRGGGCDGPPLDTQRLIGLRSMLFSQGGGSSAYLVMPNPIDATRNGSTMATSSGLQSYLRGFDLPSLASPQRLENSFLKVRIRETNDDVSTLARPDAQGRYAFPVTDVHYSEAMAYYSLVAEMGYVEALGFPVVKSRPLYVMVRANTEDNQPNALYDHNYLNPSLPRTIRLFGDTDYAPGVDAEMYRHEFGHLFNESSSHEVGMDFAGDNGAIYTEGSAIHECMADYLAQSYGNDPAIGRWIARNFDGYAPGQPLRSAVDYQGSRIRFQDVAFNDGAGGLPERYHTAEWCTRVLWEIRQSFVDRDPRLGAVYADRLMFSAMGFLRKDTSLSQFRDALVQADSQLHCGGNEDTILNAFESRGFARSFPQLARPLDVQVAPVGLDQNYQPTQIAPGVTIAFKLRIVNRNNETARNIRVKLEPLDNRFYATTYQQGYGDLAPGQSIQVGVDRNGLALDSSVFAETDRGAQRGSRLRYRIRLLVENGPESSFQGDVAL